jgi:hypothetical protein
MEMGYFNKINSSHTLLQAVKVKESQSDVSKKTLEKLATKISADINKIANRERPTGNITEALNHLNSLGTKTGASKQMAKLLESVLNSAAKGGEKRDGISNSKRSELQRQAVSTKADQQPMRASDRDQKGIGNDKTESRNATQGKEVRRGFSQVYQTNAGCKAINQMARHLFMGQNSTSLSGSAVISEYKRSHGDNAFKGLTDTQYAIKAWCPDLKSNVEKATDAFYTPSTTNRTTWRGADLTESGLRSMKDGKAEGTTFRLGQFFSTSAKKDVAESFCKTTNGAIPVLFKIEGNSSNGVRAGSGLDFNAKGAGGESETLYSPKACFTVAKISKSHDGSTIHVTLVETTHNPKANPLPY